jgi:SAM-dependent methyltransferase
MLKLLALTANSLREDGLRRTLVRIANHPKYVYHREVILRLKSPESKFTAIYKGNHWFGEESISGPGSTLDYTRNLRRELPALLRELGIRSMLDAPCGDFHWMQHVLKDHPLDYTGGDIVKPLIAALREKYGGPSVRFVHMNITNDPLPKTDLMFCRDCLFHLSYVDVRAMLENFVASGTSYLMTTTHSNNGGFENHDIVTGDSRRIDLFSAPFNLPREVSHRVSDWVAPAPEREMCVWTRNQVIESLAR